jgi:pimeloyl-ACP methyl ester carboxylesterase
VLGSGAVFARLLSLATAAALRARGFRDETLEIGDWRLRVHRGGRPGGEPWLLLHGLGATAATYLPLISHLRADCELVLPELSELGGSRGPRAAPSVPESARLVEALVERCFQDRPPTLAGISLGGWIAVRALLDRPGLAQRLLLVVPGGWRDQDWTRIGSMVRVESLAETEAIWRALFVDPPWWIRPGRYGLFLAYRSAAVREILGCVREQDAFGREELGRLELPVGLIWGERDDLFRVEVGEQMAAALPRARLEVVPEAAHAVQWERPEAFVAAVERFRRSFPLPRPPGERKIGPGKDPGGHRGDRPWPRPTTSSA